MKNEKNINDVKDSVNKFAQDMENKQLEISGKKFSFLQVGLIIGAILELVSCFLPFIEGGASIGGISVSSSSSYFSSGGFHLIVLLAALIGTCVLTFIGKKQIAIITAIFNFVWIAYDALLSGGEAREYMTVCIGAYIMMIAALIVLVMTVLGLANDKKHNK